MATTYENIYDAFLARITDFNLVDLSEEDFKKTLYKWMLGAIAQLPKFSEELLARDEENECFENDLTELSKELVVRTMVDMWVTPYINSSEQVSLFLGGKEEKIVKENLSKLIELKNSNTREMRRLYSDYTYASNSYFNI